MKALIIDRVSPVIAKGLQALGAEVDIKILPSVDELKEMLPEYDLLVMRVDPKIGRDILDTAANADYGNYVNYESRRNHGLMPGNLESGFKTLRESTVTRLRSW